MADTGAPSLNGLYKQIQDKGYAKPFAEFADWYNKNPEIAKSGVDSVIATLKGEKRDSDISAEDRKPITADKMPPIKVFGIPLMGWGFIGLGVALTIIIGIKVINSKEKQA